MNTNDINILVFIEETLREHNMIDASHSITKASSIKDDLDIDSLNILELILSLENHYDIEISYLFVDQWNTVDDIISSVIALTNNQ